ncbi:hypothetical protein Poly30_31520 [Planctomycetes bacterium Poly30]|uniref:Flippase-like domain-containing protein n=1 Tax=Saltatorellus ferox TaxID=2528018 RepID=A0A518EU80_9BACT|nr:hypothetical protein Poly30_31520 [Planctomycetes bacterium Poly30]
MSPDEEPEARTDSEAPEKGLGRRIALAVVLGLGVYIAMALWADIGGIGDALAEVPLWAPLAACALSLLNYAIRFPRWQRYLRITGSSVSGWASARIYLAGLSLTVSPGKVGEAMKSWLLRDQDGTPIARSAPIVLAERVTDLLGFLVLIAISASGSEHLWITLATVGLSAAVLAVVASRKVGDLIVATARRFPSAIARRAGRIEETLDSARGLLAPRELPLATLLAACGWFLECVGCWIIANSVLPAAAVAVGAPPIPELSLAAVTYAFALAAVAGAIVVIAPGGLGVTEGLLTGLLEGGYRTAGFATQIARSKALAVTLVTRLCTLWFAMGVGLLALQLHRRLARRSAPGTPSSPPSG